MTDALIFSLDDVQAIRKVSVNIDNFGQYAQEVQRNYVLKILGVRLYQAMLAAPADSRFVDLINGVYYDRPNGQREAYRGLKLYCGYLWLYVYSIDSATSVTPIGTRLFKDEYAEFKENVGSVKQARDYYYGTAAGMESGIIQFLKDKIVEYPEFSESREVGQAQADDIRFRVIGGRFRNSRSLL